jgi:hypothetical protein
MICGLCVLGMLRGLAADPKESGTNIIHQIDANTLQIGAVRIETKERRLVIPATVNMVEGPIEYLLVSAIGKLHESIFKTTAEPVHIQTAALLLLKSPVPTNRAPLLSVLIELSATNTLAADELIENIKPGVRLGAGSWRYNGSRIVDGTFIAQRDGSIIAIIADPDSLVESGRVAADDDENWRPKKSNLPALGTPVKLVLRFSGAAED